MQYTNMMLANFCGCVMLCNSHKNSPIDMLATLSYHISEAYKKVLEALNSIYKS